MYYTPKRKLHSYFSSDIQFQWYGLVCGIRFYFSRWNVVWLVCLSILMTHAVVYPSNILIRSSCLFFGCFHSPILSIRILYALSFFLVSNIFESQQQHLRDVSFFCISRLLKWFFCSRSFKKYVSNHT